jgi:hypothetical protein
MSSLTANLLQNYLGLEAKNNQVLNREFCFKKPAIEILVSPIFRERSLIGRLLQHNHRNSGHLPAMRGKKPAAPRGLRVREPLWSPQRVLGRSPFSFPWPTVGSGGDWTSAVSPNAPTLFLGAYSIAEPKSCQWHDFPPHPNMHVRHHRMAMDISRYRQNALANCICRGVRHSASKIAGDPTRMQTALARELATFSLFELYRNSIPRGASK